MSKPSLRVKPTPLVRKTRIPTKRKVQGFIKRKIITPFISALKDGIKPHELSLVIVLGIIFGLWPILGTGTPLSLFISWYLKLNIPIMQALHVIFTPFAIALVIPFVRVGENLIGSEHFDFNPKTIINLLFSNPWIAIKTIICALIGWGICTIPIGFISYYVIKPICTKYLEKLKRNDGKV